MNYKTTLRLRGTMGRRNDTRLPASVRPSRSAAGRHPPYTSPPPWRDSGHRAPHHAIGSYIDLPHQRNRRVQGNAFGHVMGRMGAGNRNDQHGTVSRNAGDQGRVMDIKNWYDRARYKLRINKLKIARYAVILLFFLALVILGGTIGVISPHLFN